jgi:CheY-like chemotaxis protein
MIANILIVEDVADEADLLERLLQKMLAARKQNGISELKFEYAVNAAQAKDMLSSSVLSPYHVVLLDLCIPAGLQSSEDVISGLNILDFIRERGVARQVLAVSGHPSVMLRAYQGKIEDWVKKPVVQEDLWDKFLAAWRNVILMECQELQHRRLRDLRPQVQSLDSARFNKLFSDLQQGAAQTCHELRRLLPERLMIDLDRDENDPIVQEIERLEEKIDAARAAWDSLAAGSEGSANLQRISLEDSLREAFEAVEPLYIQRRVKLDRPKGETHVASFGWDTEVVLRELLVGPLVPQSTPQSPDTAPREEDTRLEVKVTSKEGFAALRIADNLPPLRAEDVEQINQGAAIAPDAEFGRAWGLSVIQRTAMRGGGSIQVSSGPSGNVVIYKVPLMT